MIAIELILERIKITRTEKGIRQEELAEALGIDRTTYLRKESGQIPLSVEELLKIAEALDTNPAYFFKEGH
ncbi:MAG: helix-turn-helix transcriptional regulator [Thermodesulfobacteriota bacterium]